LLKEATVYPGEALAGYRAGQAGHIENEEMAARYVRQPMQENRDLPVA
jgi:hypothetical protein